MEEKLFGIEFITESKEYSKNSSGVGTRINISEKQLFGIAIFLHTFTKTILNEHFPNKIDADFLQKNNFFRWNFIFNMQDQNKIKS